MLCLERLPNLVFLTITKQKAVNDYMVIHSFFAKLALKFWGEGSRYDYLRPLFPVSLGYSFGVANASM